MPTITRIAEQKRRPNRRSIFVDGRFAFGCSVNVVARFHLREGIDLTEGQIDQIKRGQVQQECFDDATKLLGQRLHSREELRRKLSRQEYGQDVVEAVLEQLAQLGYVDDQRFARTKAMAAAEHRHHGRRRAFMELLKAGVKAEDANRALDDVYEQADPIAMARELARKRATSLRKLDPAVARRRLAGMLQRRGFDYDSIRPIIDEILGGGDEAQ